MRQFARPRVRGGKHLDLRSSFTVRRPKDGPPKLRDAILSLHRLHSHSAVPRAGVCPPVWSQLQLEAAVNQSTRRGGKPRRVRLRAYLAARWLPRRTWPICSHGGTRLFERRLVGHDGEGLGYRNVRARLPFLAAILDPPRPAERARGGHRRHFAEVTVVNLERSFLRCVGETQASSEPSPMRRSTQPIPRSAASSMCIRSLSGRRGAIGCRPRATTLSTARRRWRTE